MYFTSCNTHQTHLLSVSAQSLSDTVPTTILPRMKQTKAESHRGRSYLVWPLREVGLRADAGVVDGAGQRAVATLAARCCLGCVGA